MCLPPQKPWLHVSCCSPFSSTQAPPSASGRQLLLLLVLLSLMSACKHSTVTPEHASVCVVVTGWHVMTVKMQQRVTAWHSTSRHGSITQGAYV